LARSSALTFKDDEQSKEIYKNPLTTDDIKVNCDDLKVLSKKEYKLLLKWRESIRRYMGLNKKREEKKQDVIVEEEEENSSDEERKVMKELGDIKKEEAKKIKKQKKKDRKAKAKVIKKMQMGMEAPFDIGIEAGTIGQGDSEHLFSISNIGKESNVNVLRNSSVNSIPEIDDHGDQDIYYGSDPNLSESESDSEMDEDEKRLHKLEKSMDMIYEFHKDRQMSRQAKVKAKNEKMNRFEEWNGVEDEVRRLTEKQIKENGDDDDDSSDSETDSEIELEGGEDSMNTDEEENEGNNVTYKINDTFDESEDIKREGNNLSRKAKLFFSNDVFKGINLHEGEEDDDDENEDDDDEVIEEEEEMEQEVPEVKKSSFYDDSSSSSEDESNKKKKNKKEKKEKKRKRNEMDDDDFEVVPIAQTYESDEEMDYTLMDPEAYTMAQQIISKKGKRDLIDDSYNRRTHYYTDGLPEWFLNDEKEYNKPPQKPVTKEAVKIVREKLKALNARPIKKVAEARARKKMKAINKLEKIKKKAAVMWDNDADGEMNDKQKLQAIQKMINNAGKKKKNEVKLVVAKGFNRGIKGRPKGVKGRYKMVDARMKKELRAAKRREKENKKRRR